LSTWSVDPFVAAGGTYDGGGVPDEVDPEAAGVDEVIEEEDEPVGSGDDVVVVVEALEAAGPLTVNVVPDGIFPIISCL
jgi:hypothetical protein